MKIHSFGLTKGRVWRLTLFSIFCMYHTLTIISATMACNNEERSQRGIALLNHTYKSLYTEDYPSCLKACTNDFQCMSLNYWWKDSKCDLNSKTKYSAESKAFSRESFSTYFGLMREPEISRTSYPSCRHVHPSKGDGEYSVIDPTSSGIPSTAYCDMTTDGGPKIVNIKAVMTSTGFSILGGWTAIQLVSFTESNLHLQDSGHGFKGLFNYSDHRQTVPSTVMQLLKHEMGFKQIRFYCHKKKVGTVFHVMTNINPLGEAAVEYFSNDQISTRPQACGSYTVLPDDNSTLSRDCSKLGWNGAYYVGTHADGKLSFEWIIGSTIRLLKMPFGRLNYHRFSSFAKQRDCDDWSTGEDSLSEGDTWAVFVR